MEPATSAIKLECLNTLARIELPKNAASAAVVAPIVLLTLGKAQSLYHTTNEAITDTKAVGGYAQDKAVIVFKNIPTTGDNKVYRITIPAPAKNVADGMITLWSDKKEYIPKTDSVGTGKDGDAITAIFHTALALTGTSVFLSGTIYQTKNN